MPRWVWLLIALIVISVRWLAARSRARAGAGAGSAGSSWRPTTVSYRHMPPIQLDRCDLSPTG